MISTADTLVTRTPRGITLLEVLISCGLLVVGLSTMAAMLPAAGSRLTQATIEDRAAVLLSNATAEILNRGLVAADVFPEAGTQSGRTLALGKVLGRLPGYGALPGGREADDYFTAASTAGQRRCGSPRTFVLEDALVYDPPRFSETPVNAFFADDRGPGPRRFKEGVCWGATLSPETFPPRAGGTAVLSVAVFKREGESAEDGPGDEALPIVLTRVGSLYESDFVAAGSLLRGCSWVLAIPADPSRSPRWFKIMSSWSWAGAGGQTTRLILQNQEDFEQLTGAAAAGRTATVFAFEGIVRVDEQTVTLN